MGVVKEMDHLNVVKIYKIENTLKKMQNNYGILRKRRINNKG